MAGRIPIARRARRNWPPSRCASSEGRLWAENSGSKTRSHNSARQHALTMCDNSDPCRFPIIIAHTGKRHGRCCSPELAHASIKSRILLVLVSRHRRVHKLVVLAQKQGATLALIIRDMTTMIQTVCPMIIYLKIKEWRISSGRSRIGKKASRLFYGRSRRSIARHTLVVCPRRAGSALRR